MTREITLDVVRLFALIGGLYFGTIGVFNLIGMVM